MFLLTARNPRSGGIRIEPRIGPANRPRPVPRRRFRNAMMMCRVEYSISDAVVQVMLPMGVNFSVGLGDERERAQVSHEVALRLDNSINPRPVHPR